MPGYILHLAEAKMIIDELKKQTSLSEEWMDEFRLGCLLPDTKKKGEKITSHFWNPADLVNLAIAPDLDLFLQKYEADLNSPLMLGYYAHLYLDALYVKEFWDDILKLTDDDGNPKVLRKDITKVWICHAKKYVTSDEFFSGEYYYGDYSKMNWWISNHYQLEVPKYIEGMECPVTEVCVDDLKEVLAELTILSQEMKPGKETEVKVFSLQQLDAFIKKTAKESAKDLLKRMKFQ